jgi:hypothetical protein
MAEGAAAVELTVMIPLICVIPVAWIMILTWSGIVKMSVSIPTETATEQMAGEEHAAEPIAMTRLLYAMPVV